MKTDLPVSGWYFKSDNRTHGPISADELRELLGSGRVQPRQPVWCRQHQGSIFVHAERAANRGPAGDWPAAS